MEIIHLDKLRASTGKKLTRALFVELNETNKDQVLYTLSDKDHPDGYPSIYQRYLEMEDVEEFTFATTFFGTMRHWKALCKADWFQPFLEEMRTDLQSKLKSKALDKIRKEASDPKSKNYFQANKYLADKGYLEKNTKGRPSKQEITREAKKKAEENQELNDIIQRLEFK